MLAGSVDLGWLANGASRRWDVGSMVLMTLVFVLDMRLMAASNFISTATKGDPSWPCDLAALLRIPRAWLSASATEWSRLQVLAC